MNNGSSAQRLIKALAYHAAKYGADDAALAQLETVIITSKRRKRLPSKLEESVSILDDFGDLLRVLQENRIVEVAAYNALQKAVHAVAIDTAQLTQQAQLRRLIDVLNEELAEERKRQRKLADKMVSEIGSEGVLMLFSMNAVINTTLLAIAGHKEHKFQIIIARSPGQDARSKELCSDLKQLLPSDISVTDIPLDSAGPYMEKRLIDKLLLAPLGLTEDARIVVPIGGELLAGVAQRYNVPVLVPIAAIDLYPYDPLITHLYSQIDPTPIIRCVTVTGIYSQEKAVEMFSENLV